MKRMMNSRLFLRVVSMVLVKTFFLSSIVMAAPQDKASAAQSAAPAVAAAAKEAVTNPDNIVIPREFGLVKTKFKADIDRLVIHIQDAHCNYEAQSNIVKILEALVKNDSLKLVSVEGADGVIDTSWFKAFPDDAVRKEVADYFMKKGEITGPEFLSITTDLPIKLFGAETRSYYIENLNAFTAGYPLKADTEKHFNTVKAALDKLKGFIYNDDLRLFDAKDAEYESKKLQFNEYVRFLQSEADKQKVNLRQFDNLFKLINVLIYEKKIDFNVTDKERGDLIDELTKKLSKDGITQLVTQSISFKMGKISSADYYNYLKSLAAANAIDLARGYPNLYNYIIYNSVYSKIENEKLFNDLKACEAAIKEKIFTSDDQRTLEKLSRHIDILIGLVNIKLLNGDFDYYKARKAEFTDEAFADFIRKKAAQYGLAIEMAPPTDAVAGSITKLEDFYAIAIKRDRALVENTLAAMDKESQKIAVLVTGGFHSEGIAKLLESRGISYMVVCPSITKDVPTPYIQVLTNQRTSFEDIISGAANAAEPATNKAMLAPASIAWAAGLKETEVRKLFQQTAGGSLDGRVLKVKQWWVVEHLTKWMARAYRAAGSGLHRLAQQEDVMKEAYSMALDHRLAAMAGDGTLGSAGAAIARAAEIKAAMLDSAEFKAEFHNAFVAAQAASARERVTQVPDDANRKPEAADISAPAAETPDEGEAADNAPEKRWSRPDSVKNKVVGASLSNAVVDDSMRAPGTTFMILFGTDDKYKLPLRDEDKDRAEILPAEEKYAGLVDDLKAIIKTGIDDSDIADIIRAIGATGKDVAALKAAFTRKNLLEAFDKSYGLKIKLVQPPDKFEGLTVPGIAMMRAGANYGHYSADVNTVYCARGMVDQLLKEGTQHARQMITVTMLHELTEMVVLKKMGIKADVADSYASERIVHDVAERLERLILGPGRMVGYSALDDRLSEMTDEYYREYARRSLDAAAVNFQLSRPVEELYVGRMWQQYVNRRVHNFGNEQLRLITDKDVIRSGKIDTVKDGNFFLASMLDESKRRSILGEIRYDEIAGDPKNSAAIGGVSVTAYSLDGGIGENVGRQKFLELTAENILPELVEMAAKGTDLPYDLVYEGHKVRVSIAEAKLLQLYKKLTTQPRGTKYASVTLVPLVNYQSKASYVKLFDTICLFDRFGATGKARTYRQLLREAGVNVAYDRDNIAEKARQDDVAAKDARPMLEQADLPWIDKKTNDILVKKSGAKKWQPGGHGYWGFYFLYDAWRNAPPADGNTHVSVFYNGDNLNSGIDDHIAGAMRAKNIPIVKLTTVAAPIDKKGGKDGIKIVQLKDGTKAQVPDQMEVAVAKRSGKVREFYSGGLKGGFTGPAAVGKQPFNTNIFYINKTLLHQILVRLAAIVGNDEKFLDIIAPILIDKDAQAKDEAGEYAPIDGAIGSAIHHLNEYFLTSTNPDVKKILIDLKVKDGKLLHFVPVPRTQFFTPVKKCFDMWLQAFSDYYKPLNTDRWVLEDSDPSLVPPDYDLQDPPYKDNDKENYWNEYLNLIKSFGCASTRELKSLRVVGRVTMANVVYTNDIVSMDHVRLIGDVVIINKTGAIVDLRIKAKDLIDAKDALVLKDILIVIESDGTVKKIRLNELFRQDRKTILAALIGAGTSAEMADDMTLTIPEKAENRGAIRIYGEAIGAAEHRLIDEIIAEKVRDGEAYMIVEAPAQFRKSGDEPVRQARPSGMNGIQEDNLEKLTDVALRNGLGIVAVTGLRAALAGQNITPDLVLLSGAGRHIIYIDEKELFNLLALPNGAALITEAIGHELAYINNPQMSFAELEKLAPTANLRHALIDSDLPILNAKLSALEQAAKSVSAAECQSLAMRIMDIGWSINGLYAAVSQGGFDDLKPQVDSLLVRKSVLAEVVAGKMLAIGNAAALASVASGADSMMAAFLDGQVQKEAMTAAKAGNMLKEARVFIKEWLDSKNTIPAYMVQGIYRAMLEARSADLLYSFGAGWREFGTAGIRNPAMQSSFAAVQQLELEEFAANRYAPILPGPNLICAVTLLQQEAAVARIMKDLQAMIKAGDPALSKLDKRFLQDVENNRVTIAYDSRLNGEYFAKLLAAAFLKDGIRVDLFDNAAGVPHLAWAANREHSAFGILISASHSEANYNGFKAFLGYQMSQVDKTSKEMIVAARGKVGYGDMHLALALPSTSLDDVLRSLQGLRWIGGRTVIKGKDYLGKENELVSFYPWYYSLVKERSPLAMLPEPLMGVINRGKASPQDALKVLYTAFFGVGAVPAANFPGFLAEVGYNDVDRVTAQTDEMNGMFPGHKSPDPGIVQGWVSNLVDYFVQKAGADLSRIEAAVAALNSREAAVATDPDIDRAGVMIALPKGVRGNIKEPLTAAIRRYIERTDKIPQSGKEAVIGRVTQVMGQTLNDKFLMTANDAWTFMAYWKLRMMESAGKLEKDRVYVLEKSHVTTSALERVAQLYRDKGYKVYVVDTYVGFTEIGKKGRDLFTIAKLSWDAYRTVETVTGTSGKVDRNKLGSIIAAMKKANDELKANVPYQTAGLPIVEKAISLLERIQAQPSVDLANEALGLLNAISRTHILVGVEESNGYGELGRWDREKETVELNHISDKDGSLAAFEFLEILSYGKYLDRLTDGRQPSRTAYDMYKDLTRDIGMVCTVNSALYHPGLTGVIAKLNEIEALEKIFAYELQKRLDRGEKVELFNGRYEVTRVEIYRDEKYDNSFIGFAEEGIRLYVRTKAGSEVIVTYRPSGTGDSNRDYNWLLGPKPAANADFESYRQSIEDEMAVMVRDFYGIEDKETGYIAAGPKEFYGLLIALKEGGIGKQYEVLGKPFGQDRLALTEAEEGLYKAVSEYALAARKDTKDAPAAIAEKRAANRAAWDKYLASPEASAMPDAGKLQFKVDGTAVNVPRSAAMAWQAGLVDYLIGLITAEGAVKKFSSPDKEIETLVNKRLPAALAAAKAQPPVATSPVAAQQSDDKKAARKQNPASAAATDAARPNIKPDAANISDMTKAAPFSESPVYQKFVRADEEALRALLIGFKTTPAMVRGRTVILLIDEKVMPRMASQFAEKGVNTYLSGEGKIVIVRGTGKQLYDNFMSVNPADLTNGSVVTGATGATLDAIGRQNIGRLGRVIGIEPQDGMFISPVALVDAMLRIGYQMPEQQILERLNDIFRRSDGGKLTAEDLQKILDMTNNQILFVRPIVRIDPSEIDEANRAAQQALQSL